MNKDKQQALLAYKQKIEEEIWSYEQDIVNFRANSKSINYYENDSSDSEDDFSLTIDTGPSIPQLEMQQEKLKTCLQASQELTNLTVLQSEVNVLVKDPVVKDEKPVLEPGTWREVTADCRIDLVPFVITFYMHTPDKKFGAPSYRGLKVRLVKKPHELELEKSVLHTLRSPSDAVEVIRSYAKAYRSRRTTLAKLANRFANSLHMEQKPEGFLLHCADLLELTWRLENKWSPLSPFHHRLKFDLEFMEESYIKIITQAHKQLIDPSIDTDERTLLLAKIITTCLEAKGPLDLESDLESRTTDKESEPRNIDKDEKKDSEIMAPPKSLPKKAKQAKNAQKRSLQEENNDQTKKLKPNNDLYTKNNDVIEKNELTSNENHTSDVKKKKSNNKNDPSDIKKKKSNEATVSTAKRSNTDVNNTEIPVKKSKIDTSNKIPLKKDDGTKNTKTITNRELNNKNTSDSTKVKDAIVNNKDTNIKTTNKTKDGNPKTKKDNKVAKIKKISSTNDDKSDKKDIENPQKDILEKGKDKVTKETITAKNGTNKTKTVSKKNAIAINKENLNNVNEKSEKNDENSDKNTKLKKTISEVKKTGVKSNKPTISNDKNIPANVKNNIQSKISQEKSNTDSNTNQIKVQNQNNNKTKPNKDNIIDKVKKPTQTNNQTEKSNKTPIDKDPGNTLPKNQIKINKEKSQTVKKVTEKNIMNVKPKEKIKDIRKTVSETNLKSKTTTDNVNQHKMSNENVASNKNSEIRKTLSDTNLKNKTSLSNVKTLNKNVKATLTKTNTVIPEKSIKNIHTIKKSITNVPATKNITKPTQTLRDRFKNQKDALKPQNPQKIFKAGNPVNPTSGKTEKENKGQKIVSKIPQKKNILRVSPRKSVSTLKRQNTQDNIMNKHKIMKTTNIPRLQKKPPV